MKFVGPVPVTGCVLAVHFVASLFVCLGMVGKRMFFGQGGSVTKVW